jgi:amino acid transporter
MPSFAREIKREKNMTNAGEAYPIFDKLKNIFIGRAKTLQDKSLFHKLSLVAFFAWIGLGADGISSSCYGPEEAFRNLSGHPMLAVFVAMGTVFTIFIISSSYNQIIRLFPHGGGGYLVGSKLLSPTVGMISGCALIIDYVLTITISVSSGTDALFSFFPESMHVFKLSVAIGGVCLLILLNLRGVKESVMSLTPIFVVFIVMHVFVIIYAITMKAGDFRTVSTETSAQLHASVQQLGAWGTLFIILKAYSMGAGTFTGIEAVSNGMPILREPRVKTARRTMILMAFSLSFLVMGLMIAYALYNVQVSASKTLNAVLFDSVTAHWGSFWSRSFIVTTLVSEAALLFVAAQTGFIDGPRIMANMAIDKWFPKKYASLSDRLVTMNGVLLMGISSIILMALSRGSVALLVVLYSINVFITFSISQLGMVKHWWIDRSKLQHWKRKITVNGIGFLLTSFILVAVTIIKFGEGGWITLVITGLFVLLAVNIKKHYFKTAVKLQKVRTKALSDVHDALSLLPNHDDPAEPEEIKFNPNAKTAIILVSGFGGTGLYTFLRINESFKGIYENYIFIRIGVINSKIYRGSEELAHFKHSVKQDGSKYVKIANQFGFFGKSVWTIGTDPVSEVYIITKKITRMLPNSTFFGGQLVFNKTFFMSQLLHNHTIFSIQKRFFKFGIPIVIFPIKIE